MQKDHPINEIAETDLSILLHDQAVQEIDTNVTASRENANVLSLLLSTVSKSACTLSPCINGGTCVDATNNDGSLLEAVVFANHTQFICVCPKGYAGVKCESKLQKQMA